ncbi:peritrophin-1-like [Zophobas morio]|uniref:peritrophin-1-like n=1 Tax=Zophobas morio TaxID=2755281 RepID=UPI0030827179
MKTITAVLFLVAAALAQWTPDPLCPYPSYEPTRFPVPGDCTKYYECLGGTKTLLSCPDGFEFDYERQDCEAAGAVNCDPNDITTVTWAPSTDRPPCSATGDEVIYFPYEGDCTKFWECYQRNTYLHQCPAGYYWSQALGRCDVAANVDCEWD